MKPSHLVLIATLIFSHAGFADSHSTALQLQRAWEHANYSLHGQEKAEALASLAEAAAQARRDFADYPEVLTWTGIITSTYAGSLGGLSALRHAKQAREDFQRAIALDGDTLKGSAYTSLGVLYAKVPGWPIAFGSDDKAAELLREGLLRNPHGIDSNYFYAEFLAGKGKYAMARQYYLRAQHAEPRPGRELADAGRRREIDQGLEKLARHQ